jgi:hypothetical protein
MDVKTGKREPQLNLVGRVVFHHCIHGLHLEDENTDGDE